MYIALVSDTLRILLPDREMENISRGPTHGDVGHFPHRGVDTGQHGCKTTEYISKDSPLFPLLSQNITGATLKKRGSLAISIYLCYQVISGVKTLVTPRFKRISCFLVF